MAKIEFNAKVQTVYHVDDTVAWRYVTRPKITRKHCDMDAFRSDKRFSSYANSDLFDNLLTRQLKLANVGETIRLDRIPDCVTIDESGFLARVTIEL